MTHCIIILFSMLLKHDIYSKSIFLCQKKGTQFYFQGNYIGTCHITDFKQNFPLNLVHLVVLKNQSHRILLIGFAMGILATKHLSTSHT